jgi:HEAT repeat protein
MIHRIARPLTMPLRALSLALLLAAGTATAAPDDRAMAPSGTASQALYWQGHEQLKQGRWEQALQLFVALEQQLRRDEPAAADSALYWQAYAQHQARRVAEARATVERLQREFPQSRWLADAQRLLGAPAAGVASAAAEDPGADVAERDELVESALTGLLSAPPERALPLLQRVITGNYSARSKERALFVLSQIDDPQASAQILQIARSGEPELRDRAIRMLGMSGSEAARQALQTLYRDSADLKLRRSVLQAWMISADAESMLQAARTDASSSLRAEAVRLLGAMGALGALRQLLSESEEPEVQASALEALGIAGASDDLATVAAGAGALPLRLQALRGLGIAGAGERLVELYPRLQSVELKAAAREGLLISGHQSGLRQLYSAAQDPDEKRELLKLISVLGGDEALDAIEQAIEQGEGR